MIYMLVNKDALMLRIFIGESDRYNGKPMYNHILELLKERGIAGATVFRGIGGYGKNSVIHTSSILRLSVDLPIIIEIVDEVAKIEMIKPEICELLQDGLVTQEKIKVLFYQAGPRS